MWTIRQNNGKYQLLHNGEVVSTHNSRNDAVLSGQSMSGNPNFTGAGSATRPSSGTGSQQGGGSGSGGTTGTGFSYDAWAKMPFEQQKHYYRYAARQAGFFEWREYAEARQKGLSAQDYYSQVGRQVLGGRAKLNASQYGKHIKEFDRIHKQNFKHVAKTFGQYFEGGAYDPDIFWGGIDRITGDMGSGVETAAGGPGARRPTTGPDVVRTGTGVANDINLQEILNTLQQGGAELPTHITLAPDAQTSAATPYLAAAQAGLRGGLPNLPTEGMFAEFLAGRNLLATHGQLNPIGNIVLGGQGNQQNYASPAPSLGAVAGGMSADPQPAGTNHVSAAALFQAQPMAQQAGYRSYSPQGGGVGSAVSGFLSSLPLGLGGMFNFLTGNSAKRQAALNKHIRNIQAQNLSDNIKLNWKSFGSDFAHHLRSWDIRGKQLGLNQQLDRARWTSEDWFKDNQFRTSEALRAQGFNLGQWRTQALGRLSDSKSRFDTQIGNMYGGAVSRAQINDLWASARLEGNTASLQHAISNGLTRTVGSIRDRLTDTRASLSDYMYVKNQQIEDQLYEASLHLDKQSAFRDVAKVTDAWREKVKMEERASKKLFRGNEVQEQMYKDKVAQKQYQAQLLASGDSRGPVEMADPIRARRVSALAKISGAEAMAAERLERLSTIGETIDMAQDAFVQDPSSWNQSKKILQYFMDNLEDQ